MAAAHGPYSFRRRWHRAGTDTHWLALRTDIIPTILAGAATFVVTWGSAGLRPSDVGLPILASLVVVLIYFALSNTIEFVWHFAVAGYKNQIDDLRTQSLAGLQATHDLRTDLAISPRRSTFQAHQRPYTWLSSRLSFACQNVSQDKLPLANCRARLDNLERQEQDRTWVVPDWFSSSFLPWEAGTDPSLAPLEVGICDLIQHDREWGIGVHVGGDPRNWTITDARYRATVTWRADGCIPVTHRYEFETSGAQSLNQHVGDLRFVEPATQ